MIIFEKINVFVDSGQNSVFQGAIWTLNAPKNFSKVKWKYQCIAYFAIFYVYNIDFNHMKGTFRVTYFLRPNNSEKKIFHFSIPWGRKSYKKMIFRENFFCDFFLVETKTLWTNISKKSHCYKIVLGPYNFQVDYNNCLWFLHGMKELL